MSRFRRGTTALAVLATTLTTVLLTNPPSTAAMERPGKPLTVMTRNLYLGVDLNAPIRAALSQPSGSQAQLVAFATATHQARGIVDRTNFPARARLLAREIVTTAPDLVGLQEVALWRHGPLEIPPFSNQLGVPNATVIDYDFLQLLTDELATQGAAYRVVQVQQEADVEAPAFQTHPFDGTARDVRLTMRDAILMKVDDGLKLLDSGGANYQTRFSIGIGPATFLFVRGYNWADVRVGAKPLRFVNTHLEAERSILAKMQAAEMLAGPAAPTDKTVVIACDCNTDPLDGSSKVGDIPHWSAYNDIVGSGFTDMWLTFAPAADGWTSGLTQLVVPSATKFFDHRIDFVFARTASGVAATADKGQVTGDEAADLDPTTGLYPSDHAGVVLRLRGW